MPASNLHEILLVEDNPLRCRAPPCTRFAQRASSQNQISPRCTTAPKRSISMFCRGSYSSRRFENPPSLILLDPETSQSRRLGSPRRREKRRAHQGHSHHHSHFVQGRARPGPRLPASSVNSYIQKPVNFGPNFKKWSSNSGHVLAPDQWANRPTAAFAEHQER